MAPAYHQPSVTDENDDPPVMPGATNQNNSDGNMNGQPPVPPAAQRDDAPRPARIKICFKDMHESAVYFEMLPRMNMQKAMNAYAARVQAEQRFLRFLFDGNRIKDGDTAESLEMEDGGQVDVMTEQIGGGDNDTVNDDDWVDISSDLASMGLKKSKLEVEVKPTIGNLTKEGVDTTQRMKQAAEQPAQEISRLCNEISVLQAKNATRVTLLQGAKSDLQAERTQLQRDKTQLIQDNQLVLAREQDLQQEVAKLPGYVGRSVASRKEISALQAKTITLEMAKSQLEQTVELLQKKLTNRKVSWAGLQAENNGLKETNTILQQNFHDVQEVKGRLHLDLVKLHDRYQNHDEIKTCLEDEIATLKVRISELEAGKSVLQNAVTTPVAAAVSKPSEAKELSRHNSHGESRMMIRLRNCHEAGFQCILRRTSKFKKAMDMWAGKFGLDVTKLVLVFKGERIYETDTPEDCDMIEGDVVEVFYREVTHVSASES